MEDQQKRGNVVAHSLANGEFLDSLVRILIIISPKLKNASLARGPSEKVRPHKAKGGECVLENTVK